MSKIGKQPILIPAGTTVTVEGKKIVVKGSKGELSRTLPREVEVKVEGENVLVTRKGNSKVSLIDQLKTVDFSLYYNEGTYQK